MRLDSKAISRRSFLVGMGALGAASLLGLAGCGHTEAGASEAGTQGGDHKVAMLMDASVNSSSFTSQPYAAMQKTAEELGWDYANTENVAQADYVSTMEGYINQGFDLIVLCGDQYNTAVEQTAKDYPDTNFAIVSSQLQAENIEGLFLDGRVLGLMGGVVAGLTTKTNSIAYMCGQETSINDMVWEGFQAAAKAVNPSVTTDVAWVGSYTDVAAGKEAAYTLVNSKDVDVLVGEGDADSDGAAQAFKEINISEGKLSRLVVGVGTDRVADDDELYVCSTMTDYGIMVTKAMHDLNDGSFGNKIVRGDASNGAVTLGIFSDKLVDADTQKKITDYVEKIKDGSLS